MAVDDRIPPVFLCWFVCFGSLAAYFWAYDDRVTSVALGVIGMAGIIGYCVGGTVVLASSFTMAIAVLLTAQVERAFGPAIAELFGTSGVLNRVLTITLVSVTLSLATIIVAEVVWNRIMEKRLRLMSYNRSFGLLLGAIQGTVVCLGILGASLVTAPYAKAARGAEVHTVQDYMRHCTADSITRIGAGARQSPMYPLLQVANPFHRLPSLRTLSRSSHELRATGRSTTEGPRRRDSRAR